MQALFLTLVLLAGVCGAIGAGFAHDPIHVNDGSTPQPPKPNDGSTPQPPRP